MKKLCILVGFMTLPLANLSLAGTMHVFKDKDGRILLTNQIDSDGTPKAKEYKDFDKLVKSTNYDDRELNNTQNSYQAFLKNLNRIGTVQNNIQIYQGITPRGNAIYFDGSRQFDQVTGFVIDEILKNKKVKYSWTNLDSSINGNFKFTIYDVDCKKSMVLTNKNELIKISNISVLHQVTANHACRILNKK